MMSLSTNLTTNVTFTDIYDNAEDFVNDYKTSGLYNDSNKITDPTFNSFKTPL